MRFTFSHRVIGFALTACTVGMMGQSCTPPVDGGGGGPEPQLVFSGLNAALLSVSGTGASDVYAVGADPGDGSGPYVLHYNGQNWRRLLTGATGDLWWISVAPVDGRFYMAGSGGKVLVFDPSAGAFTPLDTPGDDTVFGVWASASEDVWAVGGDLGAPDTGGFVWNYDGSEWTVVDLSAVLPAGTPLLYKVWGRGPNDVYVVGRLGLVLHYDGASWTQLDTDTTRTLFTVNGNASLVVASGGLGNAVLLEPAGDALANQAPASLPQMNGVYVPDSGDAYAAGNDATLARRGSGGWAVEATFDTTWDFHACWVDPEGGVWAVGGNLGASLDNGILGYLGSRTISSNTGS